MKDKRVKVTLDGRAIVRKNKKYIYEGEFRDNEALTHARLPPNICEIRSRAFSGCRNLEEIRFEGSSLESIGEEAFAGCQKLRSMSLPDDTLVYCYAFRGCTGLEAPIFNDSGTVLYTYPVSRKDSRYCVPEGVREISSTAFLDNRTLEEVVLPDSVETIGFKAFCESDIKKVIIPASVKELPEKAFYNCRQLDTVVFLGDTRIAYNAFSGAPETLKLFSLVRHIQPHERFWAMGGTFLKAESPELPDGSHVQDPIFLSLAEGCANGDADSMWDLAGYFDFLYSLEEHSFYCLAANFWKFFAFLSGSQDAAVWYSEWEHDHPEGRLPAVLDESRSGEAVNGSIYRYLGYLDFDDNILYDVHPTANSGVTLICIYPIEDGTWEFSHYQFTYRDEYLNELPVTTYYHPDSKPDRNSFPPYLFSIMGQAISASFKRNGNKRKGNAFFIPMA